MHFGPAFGADTDDSRGPDAFDDEIGLKPDLDAAAAERDISVCPGNVNDFSGRCHATGAVVAGGMLQGALRPIHLRPHALPEVGIEGGIHAAEQRRGDGRAAKLAILQPAVRDSK